MTLLDALSERVAVGAAKLREEVYEVLSTVAAGLQALDLGGKTRGVWSWILTPLVIAADAGLGRLALHTCREQPTVGTVYAYLAKLFLALVSVG